MTAPVWTATAVALVVDDGTDQVAGWRYGELFIDFRLSTTGPLPFCWMVSHIPTGFGVVGLLTDRSGAQALVETLYPLADWGTLRGHNMQPSPSIRAWMDLLPVGCCMAYETIAAFTTVEHSKETVQ